MALNAKQKRFVNEYLIDLNATQAAIRSGYSKKTAKQIGTENLSKPAISAEIKRRQEIRTEKTIITQDQVLADIISIQSDAMQKFKDNRGVDGMLNHSAALKASELLAKHLGMFTDKVELFGKDGGPIGIANVSDQQGERIAKEFLLKVKVDASK